MRYDTIRYIYVRPKADKAALANLPHETNQKIATKKLKTKKRDAQKKRSSQKAVESVQRLGRESRVGKICERGRP